MTDADDHGEALTLLNSTAVLGCTPFSIFRDVDVAKFNWKRVIAITHYLNSMTSQEAAASEL